MICNYVSDVYKADTQSCGDVQTKKRTEEAVYWFVLMSKFNVLKSIVKMCIFFLIQYVVTESIIHFLC